MSGWGNTLYTDEYKIRELEEEIEDLNERNRQLSEEIYTLQQKIADAAAILIF